MDNRISRKQIAERTLQEIQQGYYLNSQGNKISIKKDVQDSIAGSRVYAQEALDLLLTNTKALSNSNVVSVAQLSTIQCLSNVYSESRKIALLNFASAKNAGGGFLGGSQAQEESLARSSSLYPTLVKNEEYYESNRNAINTFYKDNLIYSPQVVFFKNDEGNYFEPYLKADVITMPAVNKGALKFKDEQIQIEIDRVMKQRIRYVLAVSEKNTVDLLILGAWGCGVFQNDPEKIAENFREVLAEKPKFNIPQIIFAVPNSARNTYDTFKRVLSLPL